MPRKFSTPDEFATVATRYFQICMQKSKDDGGAPPTLPGLASRLGFSNKSEMDRWASHPANALYRSCYLKALNDIEEWLVEKASSVGTKNSRGIEFILANQFKYANQQVIQVQGALNQLVDKTVEILGKFVGDEQMEEALAAYRNVVAEACDY